MSLTYESKESLQLSLLHPGTYEGEYSRQKHGRSKQGLPTDVVQGKHAEEVGGDL